MRKRYIATLIVAALVAGVVTYQAITHEPPPPYVEIAHRRDVPVVTNECRDGELFMTYTTSHNERFEPAPTGRPC